MILDLISLSLKSSRKHVMTTPASPELRGYNADEDTQLPTPEPTPEALVPMPEPTPAAVDSPPASNTGKQPAFTDCQTNQSKPDESNLVDELVDTSVCPAKKTSTQLRLADLLPEHII